MNSDGDKIHIKIVAFKEIYNFVSVGGATVALFTNVVPHGGWNAVAPPTVVSYGVVPQTPCGMAVII
jgi:hypothetical protein